MHIPWLYFHTYIYIPHYTLLSHSATTTTANTEQFTLHHFNGLESAGRSATLTSFHISVRCVLCVILFYLFVEVIFTLGYVSPHYHCTIHSILHFIHSHCQVVGGCGGARGGFRGGRARFLWLLLLPHRGGVLCIDVVYCVRCVFISVLQFILYSLPCRTG